MVHLTNTLNRFGYIHGPHRIYKRMQVFRFTWHYYGRHRRCYKLAVQRLHKAWLHATRNRKMKGLLYKEIWQTRIDAACKEHGIKYFEFTESLTRQNIHLNHAVLNDLAIYEPRTFKSLCNVAKQHIVNTGLYNLTLEEPEGVFNRSMFTDELKQ
ncbi:39S ribosomal mitochondrial [Brachionus plicatilis]|uniref:Large ribosomal subunit protein bL20m n=1 Tax=Brachionus plicatilis TaxID=10195 RepID=A0A3M7PQ00_BRAPC|nr:39S ribosomal mitochondrial [Brachionus plicatilis]